MIRAMSAPDADRIRAAAGCDALLVRVVDETPSTNETLMESPFGRVPAPATLLATLRQHAGRGRRGRAWLCEPGRSLAFSIAFERVVRNEPPPAALSIVAGTAVAAALAPWAPGIGLKWPNDLQLAGRKLGGILVESRRSPPSMDLRVETAIERIVVGIGINLAAPREPQLVHSACGLFDGTDLRDDPGVLIGCMAGEVVRAFERFLSDGLAPFVARWERLDALRGAPVVVLDGERVIASGCALGIDADGALRLLGPCGVETVRSGEVSLRRSDEWAVGAAAGGVAHR